MSTIVQSIHFDADRDLVNFIESKVGKLSQYYDRIIDSEVYLKVDKNAANENKIAERQSCLITVNHLLAAPE
jgi:putative sigma-54 modulation protein